MIGNNKYQKMNESNIEWKLIKNIQVECQIYR